MKPFEGVRVLDLSAGIAGPHAGMLLAMNGAEVVKVEPPEGDWGRRLGTHRDDHSAYSIYYNQGKKSLSLDLKTSQAKTVLRKLIADSDVFIESFRPGVIKRLGFSFEDVIAINPKVIYLSVSGFGQTGELSAFPGTDSAIQAYTGLMYLNRGRTGIPKRFPYTLIDVVAGIYAYSMMASAFISMLRSANGAYIDCSLAHVSLALQGGAILKHQMDMMSLPQEPVPVGAFKTSDGYISISVSRDDQFDRLCACLEREDLRTSSLYITNESRNSNKSVLLEELQREFLKENNEAWHRKLSQVDIVHGVVNDYDALLASRELRDLNVMTETYIPALSEAFSFPTTPTPRWPDSVSKNAPRIGEHSTEVLDSFGFKEEEIQHLLKLQIVRQQ